MILKSNWLAWDSLLLRVDKLVDKDNPNIDVLDWRNTMLPHQNRMDRAHQSVRNDLQKNSDK